jgi:site-specific recombinase XerD
MRISSAIKRFETQLRADRKSEHTRRAYLRDLINLSYWLGSNRDITNIAPVKLARYLASECSLSRPAISLNRTKTALRMFFKVLTDAGYIESNPARMIKNGRTEPKTPEHLTAVEVRKLLGAITLRDGPIARRDRVMFTLLLQTGIRLGALVKLEVRDVRLAERILKVNGKGGIERSVYLTSKLRRVLKSYIAAMKLRPDDPLFPSRNGGHLGRRQIQLRFHHWLKKAGIKRHLTVHSTRHAFAMRLYRQTGDLRLVQTALGHRHISTTEIYARVENKTLRRALEKL